MTKRIHGSLTPRLGNVLIIVNAHSVEQTIEFMIADRRPRKEKLKPVGWALNDG